MIACLLSHLTSKGGKKNKGEKKRRRKKICIQLLRIGSTNISTKNVRFYLHFHFEKSRYLRTVCKNFIKECRGMGSRIVK